MLIKDLFEENKDIPLNKRKWEIIDANWVGISEEDKVRFRPGLVFTFPDLGSSKESMLAPNASTRSYLQSVKIGEIADAGQRFFMFKIKRVSDDSGVTFK